MRIHKALMTLVALILVSRLYGAETDNGELTPRQANRRVVESIFLKQTEQYGANMNMLVRPGLLADRQKREVMFFAEASGLSDKDPVEFFLISEDSGHEYETLAIAFARPSAIHQALLFIGMQRGQRFDIEKLRLWPKGERVTVTVKRFNDPEKGPVRIEELIVSGDPRRPLPLTGLVFTGSLADEAEFNESDYPADLYSPNSIASLYNEATTVLDVPRQAVQTEVYQSQFLNPDHLLPEGELLAVTMVPERDDGELRVRDLVMSAYVAPDSTGNSLEEMYFSLADRSAGQIRKDASLNQLLEEITALIAKGQDPFVEIHFDDNLPMQGLHRLCGLLSSIETEKGIRVEPPAEGDIYYKAFIPDEANRERENRVAQPWELHLSVDGLEISGVLTEIEQIWKDDEARPELQVREHAIPNPAALQQALKENGPGMRVILVFVDGDLKYGQLMAFLRPNLKAYPIIHVYLNRER